MRDWSTLRAREWQPTGASAATAQTSAGDEPERKPADAEVKGADCEGGEGRGGNSHGSAASTAPTSGSNGVRKGGSNFRTDTEISSSKNAGERKKLQRWDATEHAAEENFALEELGGKTSKSQKNGSNKNVVWDQFKANYELFGVKSTYKADMSQYTTPLDPSRVPAELRRKAERIAHEIDKGGRSGGMDEGMGHDGDSDEENLFSAVPRSHGYNQYGGSWADEGDWGWNSGEAAEAPAAPSGPLDGGAGAALLSTLMAAAPAAGPSEENYRAMVSSKVHAWWRSRSSDGEAVPAGEESGMVCPFSRKFFPDVSQLLMHWAAALPREGEKEPSTPCAVATEQLRNAASELRWCDLIATYKLADVLSVDAPRQGSVWEQVLTRMNKASSADKGPLEERMSSDFAREVTSIKCWRRDQKVEHRELLESVAAALAMRVLDTSGGGRKWPMVDA